MTPDNIVYLNTPPEPPEPSNEYAHRAFIKWDDDHWKLNVLTLDAEYQFESEDLMELLMRFFHMADESRNR